MQSTEYISCVGEVFHVVLKLTFVLQVAFCFLNVEFVFWETFSPLLSLPISLCNRHEDVWIFCKWNEGKWKSFFIQMQCTSSTKSDENKLRFILTLRFPAAFLLTHYHNIYFPLVLEIQSSLLIRTSEYTLSGNIHINFFMWKNNYTVSLGNKYVFSYSLPK